MITEDIEKILALSEEASLDWEIEKHDSLDKRFWIYGADVMVDYDDVNHKEQDANAMFIVNARNIVPKLCLALKEANEVMMDIHQDAEAGEPMDGSNYASVKRVVRAYLQRYELIKEEYNEN
jgi:hypothetical protein